MGGVGGSCNLYDPQRLCVPRYDPVAMVWKDIIGVVRTTRHYAALVDRDILGC